MDTLQELTAKLDQERMRQQDRLSEQHKQHPGSHESFSLLKKELEQKDELLKQTEEKSNKQARKIELLSKEMSEMEDQLNKSYNQTLESLRAGMLQVQQEKQELLAHMAELEFQVSNCKQVAELTQQTLQHEQDQAAADENQVLLAQTAAASAGEAQS